MGIIKLKLASIGHHLEGIEFNPSSENLTLKTNATRVMVFSISRKDNVKYYQNFFHIPKVDSLGFPTKHGTT